MVMRVITFWQIKNSIERDDMNSKNLELIRRIISKLSISLFIFMLLYNLMIIDKYLQDISTRVRLSAGKHLSNKLK